MPSPTEQSDYSRNRLIQSLLQIGHGDLTPFVVPGALAATAEPELFGRLIAWNLERGKVWDSKIAFPALALYSLKENDRELAQNAVAAAMALAPRRVVKWYHFLKKLKLISQMPLTAGVGREVKDGLELYLAKRELHRGWWQDSVIQDRSAMRSLYRIRHRRPGDVQNLILFHNMYPPGSTFEVISHLRDMPPDEAAGAILKYRIPFLIAIGALRTIKEPDILLALIERMTGNELVTNSKLLERAGVMANPALRGAYEAALTRAKKSKKVDALKAGRAAEALEEQEQCSGGVMAGKLRALQAEKTRQLGTIEGDWLVLGDCSSSMKDSIDAARRIAALIAERVKGQVHLVFFSTVPTHIEVTGLTYDQILEKTKRIKAEGNTSIGVGLDFILSRGDAVQGIVIVSDGGENRGPLFPEVYHKYAKKFEIEPTVYLFRVAGDPDRVSGACEHAGIQVDKFEASSGVDYYSLPNFIEVLKTAKNRYGLLTQIMETPLLTYDKVFELKEQYEATVN